MPPISFAPSPGPVRGFAGGLLIEPHDPRRADTEAFIAQAYRSRYGAELSSFLPHLLAYHGEADELHAAVGLRCGTEGGLFVEQYLDVPAEQAIATAIGRPVGRAELVEVGNFGAVSAGHARALIVNMTHRLHSAGFRWVLFVATRQLRNAFDRLHLATIELAEARAERLAGDHRHWGSYYDAQPRLMFGDIAAGHAYLLRSQDPGEASSSVQAFSPCLAAGAL